MKILAIGDFHGKFPKKFERLIKKEKIDLVISNGDYCDFTLRKDFFKYMYATDIYLWDVIGKKKYKEGVKKDLVSGESVLKKLNSLEVPIVGVVGNLDHSKYDEATDYVKVNKKYNKKYVNWTWSFQDFFGPFKKKYKKIKWINYSYYKIGGYVFIGWPRSSFPGRVKSRAYKRQRKKMDKLFKKFNKENKERKLIFVAHNVPYNTKLDLITSKEAHERAKGVHYGAKLSRRLIDRYQPILAIGGHIHESKGKQKLGKTLVVNPGAVHEGNAAIVEINGKIKVKFVN